MDESTSPHAATAGDAVPLRLTAASVARTLVAITPQLRAFALRRGVAREEIKDLLQDAAENVLLHLDRTEIRSAEAYIRTTFARLVVDYHRSRRPEHSGWSGLDGVEDSDAFQRIVDRYDSVRGNLAEQLDRANCVEKVLLEIESQHPLRGIALELAFQGISGREMAPMLGKPPSAANEFLSQTRKLFERLVRERCEEEFNRD